MSESKPITNGAHHIGLTVSQLEASANFFIDVLGWIEVSRDSNYPSIFISDGKLMITLWEINSSNPNQFDKNVNVGLHHLALSVEDLDRVYKKVVDYGLKIEFPPENLKNGPARHMMCFDPSEIRIEFICVPS